VKGNNMTKILGFGGCGRNILNRLIDIGFDPDMVVYMDTAPGTLATMYSDTDKLVAEKVMDLLKRL
jgi:cell division GTPase FtsZ